MGSRRLHALRSATLADHITSSPVEDAFASKPSYDGRPKHRIIRASSTTTTTTTTTNNTANNKNRNKININSNQSSIKGLKRPTTINVLSVPTNNKNSSSSIGEQNHISLVQSSLPTLEPNENSVQFVSPTQRWRSQMRTKSSSWTSTKRKHWSPHHHVLPRWSILLLLCTFGTIIPFIHTFTCPPVNLIHRLTAPNGASVNRNIPISNETPECDCTIVQEGGWEINCYATTNENTNQDESKSNANKWSSPRDFDSPDYNIDYNILMVSFSVRYTIGQQLKITCDHGAPIFKPALFQGFGIESIDTFQIERCELPISLPLSVILYRTTPKHAFTINSRLGDSAYSFNSSGNAMANDLVAPIRSLTLTSSKAVTIQQLNTLLSELESLEQLTLNDFNLSDVDDFGVESFDRPAERRLNRLRRQRSIPSVPYQLRPITTTTMMPEIDIKTARNEEHEITTISIEPIKESPEISNPSEPSVELAKFDIQSNNTMLVTTTTIMPLIEETTLQFNSSEVEFTPANSTGRNIQLDDMETIESDSNDVNVENKPIIVLDENALNFGKILPNLRILRLRHFIKESNIPNVLFQILHGLTKLEYLELDSNILNHLPRSAMSFASKSLKKLYLYKNSIKEIDENAFINLTRLEILDLSQNQLTTIPDHALKPLKNLLYLSFRNNKLKSLSKNVFQTNYKLTSLDLSQNRGLEPLPANLFNGLANLSNVSLSYCNMTKISSNFLHLMRSIPSLTKMELKGNQLKNLTISGLFGWNQLLSKLDVSANRITTISSAIFSSNSSHLIELNLNRNQLTELPDDLFKQVRNLRKLSVAYNDLRQTSPNTFIHLRSLEELILSKNKIVTLNTLVNQLPFGIGGNLKKVDLSYNNLTNFDVDINGVNWHLYLLLSELNLKNNQFNGTLRVPIFSTSIETIIDLDLSSNQFTAVDVDHITAGMEFDWKSADFSDTDMLSTQSLETQVRLDNNPLECNCLLFPFVNYTKATGHLFSKHVHSISRKTVFVIDSSNSLACAQPMELLNRPINHLLLDELVCHINDTRICPDECHCLYRSMDSSAIIDCDNVGLQQLPIQLNLSRYYNISIEETSEKVSLVDNVQILLRNNSIASIDRLNQMFHWSHDKLTAPSFIEIWLDGNRINSIDSNLIPHDNKSSTMPILRTLSLRANNLTMIPIEFLKTFEKFGNNGTGRTSKHVESGDRTLESRLYLGHNPIDCYNDPMPPNANCYIRNLKTWLSTHADRVGDINAIECDGNTVNMRSMNETSNLVLLNMTDTILCPIVTPLAHNGMLLALSIICVMLASSLFVVSVLYYRNKQTILAFIYIHLNPIFICLSFTEDDLDEDKIYDAFVSYSSLDRDIVMELIEKLEKPIDMSEANLMLQNGCTIHEGKADRIVPENEFNKSKSGKEIDTESANDGQSRHRLCIHERDWLPGNLISWNIVNSVQNSKRTILVLSQNFINSIWFQVEFHTAYYQMLEDKIDRLIVIVRGDLPPKEEMDKDLAFLLTTKTYLVWGEKWFWEKLYYAMPHKPKQNVTQFSKNGHFDSKKMPSINGKHKGQVKLNGSSTNQHKPGMLKWSSKGSQAEMMKDYVDKTIASHFQLNTLQSNNRQSNGNGDQPKPAPKSLRNSGTLSSMATTNGNGRNAAAYDNKSFINETNT